jgi:hypothetical protein
MNCITCGKEIMVLNRHQKFKAGQKLPITCNRECGARTPTKRKASSEAMAKTNKKYASERMKLRNPMRIPENRAKMATTLRAMGWKPPVQGGNGKPVPLPQKLLACRLGWELEFPIPTNKARDSGYPTCYKADIANPVLKIVVEVDGGSHYGLRRKQEDKKRTELLCVLGWKVLRFSNQEVTDDLEGCVQTVLSTISK